MSKKETKYSDFIDILNKGMWRDRYYAVQQKKFVALELDKNEQCVQALIRCALNDNATLVRQEAVRTCNLLGILHKGKSVTLRKMPPLNQLTKSTKKLQEKVFISCVESGIKMYPLKRTLDKEELMKISVKFSELYPTVYDIIDGRTTENTKGNISRKKNRNIYKMIQKHFSQITEERLQQYYKHHHDKRVDD